MQSGRGGCSTEGDEALALISARARADIAEALDEKGRLLPLEHWPESLRLAIRPRIDKDGNLEWQFDDALRRLSGAGEMC